MLNKSRLSIGNTADGSHWMRTRYHSAFSPASFSPLLVFSFRHKYSSSCWVVYLKLHSSAARLLLDKQGHRHPTRASATEATHHARVNLNSNFQFIFWEDPESYEWIHLNFFRLFLANRAIREVAFSLRAVCVDRDASHSKRKFFIARLAINWSLIWLEFDARGRRGRRG